MDEKSAMVAAPPERDLQDGEMRVIEESAGVKRRLASERGIALVMALGVMFVLAILVTSVSYYVTTNSGTAARSSADATAYGLAEAGLNDAFSVLAANYPAPYPG